tara:strand:- start:2219 stop:3262 length:1044 start_codon:yes stop_codon:yes gene_type:complete
MYKDIKKTFNLITSIIALLFIISLFILRDNIIRLNKKNENNDKNKLKIRGGVNTVYFWISFFKILAVIYSILIYLFLFGTFLDWVADDIMTGVGILFLFALVISLLTTMLLSILLTNPDNYINIFTNFIVSILLVVGVIDRLLISSYSMGCVMENANFSAVMHSTKTGDIQDLWDNLHIQFKSNIGAGEDAGAGSGAGQEEDLVGKLEDKLFKGTIPVLWHDKCDDTGEKAINSGDVTDKAYCYTADDLNDMKTKWRLDGSNKPQSIYNNCMVMYYRKHDLGKLGLGLFTNPEFIGYNTAAQKAFFINCVVFFGSIGLLILSDTDAGLRKLGSLIALESHKKAFDKV